MYAENERLVTQEIKMWEEEIVNRKENQKAQPVIKLIREVED